MQLLFLFKIIGWLLLMTHNWEFLPFVISDVIINMNYRLIKCLILIQLQLIDKESIIFTIEFFYLIFQKWFEIWWKKK